MNNAYIITPEELALKGLNLSEYVLDETFIPAIIYLGLDICVDRICELCDNIQFESDIETKLQDNPKLVDPFKKLQYRVIYRLVFMNEESPVDIFVDSIIAKQLNMGKLNAVQKGLRYKND